MQSLSCGLLSGAAGVHRLPLAARPIKVNDWPRTTRPFSGDWRPAIALVAVAVEVDRRARTPLARFADSRFGGFWRGGMILGAHLAHGLQYLQIQRLAPLLCQGLPVCHFGSSADRLATESQVRRPAAITSAVLLTKH
jgi:hypothetical protein